MIRIRFALFGAVLAAGVAAAVASLVAQSPAPRPDPRPQLMVLDGRGSQLGVVVDDLGRADLDDQKGLTAGVRIEDVAEGSAAEKAGVREGDIVIEYDGERVRSARQFSRLVRETPEGRAVPMVVVRAGERQTLSVTPEGRSAAWRFDLDGRRLGRDIERGLRDLPRLREFRFDGPAFDFDLTVPRLSSPRGRLGVRLGDLSPQLAEYFGARDGGVLVTSVMDDSPAAKAGLRAGDVITTVNGVRVRDYDALASALRGIDGGEVTLGIIRDRQESTVKATLEEPPSRTRRPVSFSWPA